MTPTILVLILALVLAVPHAEATCTWVLWSNAERNTGLKWDIAGFHESIQSCSEALRETLFSAERKGYPAIHHPDSGPHLTSGATLSPSFGVVVCKCLPDTIDPHGPKGGGR